jgi:hypothetical protein
MLDVARIGAADVVSLKLVKHGGLLATRDVAARDGYGQGRYSLWTGDVGLAIYLWDCLADLRSGKDDNVHHRLIRLYTSDACRGRRLTVRHSGVTAEVEVDEDRG